MQIKPAPAVLALTALVAFSAARLSAQPVLGSTRITDYLPAGTSYTLDIPKPSSVLGWEVGRWHVRHDLLVAYMRALAKASDRIALEVTGKTHEERPLLLLVISSPENLSRLDEILAEHRKLTDPAAEKPDTADMPVVVYMGYSIHGNEASGSNASLAVAYHLAAARGEAIDELLDNAVVLLDPSLNPDGLSRFAQWANMHRGRLTVADPNHREHTEGWPNGRTNHYWFDLNRDWLPLVHPESRARLKSFHRFKPNILTDHHEMGTDQTFFFQPGIPSRRNPLTPEKNVELTQAIAEFHAAALDRIGSLYFTEEIFDDFYYGKGSTYPDANGTIGILFEQGSVRGHRQESIHGEIDFPFAIRNQVTTSLSTLEAAKNLRVRLLDYQAEFYRQGLADARAGDLKAYVWSAGRDTARAWLFADLLDRHQVEVHALTREVTADGHTFRPGEAWIVPLEQDQYRLIRALFETSLDFADTTFYDVSTWTMPLAYGLAHAELRSGDGFVPDLVGDVVPPTRPVGRMTASSVPTTAYLFDWDGYFAPRALHRLLAAGIRARVAAVPFTATTPEGEREFGYGTIVLPLGIQQLEPGVLEGVLRDITELDAVDVLTATTGLTSSGIDLGSPRLRHLELPRVALVVGGGVSTYEAGEIWHLLDQRFEIPLTLIEADRLGRVKLHEYTHLILVDGSYGAWGEDTVETLGRWVREGGVLIATKRAATWVDSKLRGNGKSEDEEDDDEEDERLPYAESQERRAVDLVSGAIFEVALDTTHPLAYGYRDEGLAVFRNSTLRLEKEDDPYVTVAAYRDTPLLSGYISDENLEKIAGTPAVVATRMGDGLVVRMVDNPSFRGFWHATHKLFLNAVFFGPTVEQTSRGRRR